MVGLQSSYLNYQVVVRDLDRSLARKAAEPALARDVARFTEAAADIRSVDDLFDDDRTYGFAVKAYGMDELLYARALIRRVVSEGAGSDSYARRLADSRYLDLAGAFQVTDSGRAPPVLQASALTVAQRYRDNLDGIGKRGSGKAEERILEYRIEMDKLKDFDAFLNSDLALTFTLRAFGLDRQALQPGEVRKVVTDEMAARAAGGSGAYISGLDTVGIDDADGRYRFGRFIDAFLASGGAEGQEAVIASYRMEAPKFGERLAAGVDDDIVAFYEGLDKIKVADDLAGNWQTLSVGLRAFDLEHLIGQEKAIVAALKGDARALSLTSAADRANFEAFSAAFAFERDGTPTVAPLVRDVEKTVQAYIRQTLEVDIGNEDTNVRLALYFQRKAEGIKSFYDILGDEALAEVVRTAFGVPPETAASDLDAQVRMMERHIGIADFQDPEKVEKLISRFLLLAESNTAAASAPVLSLFGGGSGLADISYDLLQARQSLGR